MDSKGLGVRAGREFLHDLEGPYIHHGNGVFLPKGDVNLGVVRCKANATWTLAHRHGSFYFATAGIEYRERAIILVGDKGTICRFGSSRLECYEEHAQRQGNVFHLEAPCA